MPEAIPLQQTGAGVIVTVCTYNEKENLSALIDSIFQYLPSAHVLVMDDNSPDGTGALADKLAAADQRVHVEHRYDERGLGSATYKAFQWGVAAGYQYLINLDADFSHHPRHLPELLNCLKQSGVDVAIGSRYLPGGKILGWPARRHLMSRCINFWTRFWMGLKIRDCSGSYRCYRTDLLKRINFSEFRSSGYAAQEELLFRCARAGASFAEIPITFEDRRAGHSKINLKEAWVAVKMIMLCSFEKSQTKR